MLKSGPRSKSKLLSTGNATALDQSLNRTATPASSTVLTARQSRLLCYDTR